MHSSEDKDNYKDKQNEKFSREEKEIDKESLIDGKVLVKVDYSSLNYKDAMILKDGGRIVRKFPFVPVSYTHLTLPTNREV